jgi:phosphomannomutase
MLKRGADGWRGIIGEKFSNSTAIHLSQGVAKFLTEKQGEGTVLVTHDARLRSKEVADAIVQTLSADGFNIVYGGMQSTPAASQAVLQENCIGAILVTASHNPFYWNGIKVKVAPGLPPSREDEDKIEKFLVASSAGASSYPGHVHIVERSQIYEGYARKVLQALPQEEIEKIRKRRFKIVVDALHGVSADSFIALFTLLGCDLTLLGREPDPLFQGILPDPMNPVSRKRLKEKMEQESFDFGFISDGDGDRLGVMNEKGEFVWPHDILALLFEKLAKDFPGGMAVTGPTGSIADRVCKHWGRNIFKTAVGFKYVSTHLQKREAFIAGGAVGEIGYSLFQNMDRDPLTSALFLLHLSLQKKSSLSQMILDLHNRYGHTVYKQWTVSQKSNLDLKEFGVQLVEHLGYSVKKINQFDGFQIVIDECAWVLVRNATTEGGIRIYAELHNNEELDRLFAYICKTTGSIPEEKA